MEKQTITYKKIGRVTGFHNAIAYRPSLPITKKADGIEALKYTRISKLDLLICSHGGHDSMAFPAEELELNEDGTLQIDRSKVDLVSVAGNWGRYTTDEALLKQVSEYNDYFFGGIIEKAIQNG